MNIDEMKQQKKLIIEAVKELSPCTIPEVAEFTKLPLGDVRQWVQHFHDTGEIASSGSKVCRVTNARLPSFKIRDADIMRLKKQKRFAID